MISVGSRGTDDSPRHEHGSTAAELAQAAFSPVAVIRRRHTHQPLPAGRWIVAALDKSRAASTVLQTAMDEASLRAAPVLALTRWSTAAPSAVKDHQDLRAMLNHYLAEAREDDANIQICTLPMSDHIANLLAQSATIDQLVIVDSNAPALIAEVVGPEARKVLRHTNCSVLVLR